MSKRTSLIPVQRIERSILVIRDQKEMLDHDFAALRSQFVTATAKGEAESPLRRQIPRVLPADGRPGVSAHVDRLALPGKSRDDRMDCRGQPRFSLW